MQFKRNLIFLAPFLIVLIWGLYSTSQWVHWKNRYIKGYYTSKEICEKQTIPEGFCIDFPESLPKLPDAVTVYFDITGNLALRTIQIIAPLFVMIPAIWIFHKQLKTGFIKNILTRTKYSSYMIKTYITSLKSVLILPLAMLILFGLSFALTKNLDFESTSNIYPGYTLLDKGHLDNFLLYFTNYVFGLIIHGIFWVNLAYIFAKKNKNLIVVILTSFLSYIGIAVLSEIIIGGIAYNIFKIPIDNFNLMNIWLYGGIENYFHLTLYGIFLVITTFVIMYFCYRDKEGIWIENEK